MEVFVAKRLRNLHFPSLRVARFPVRFQSGIQSVRGAARVWRIARAVGPVPFGVRLVARVRLFRDGDGGSLWDRLRCKCGDKTFLRKKRVLSQ